MSREAEIKQAEQQLEDFKEMLKLMPKDSKLGVMYVRSCIRRTEKKLKKLMSETE
jgi:hypothetical protein